MTGRRLAPLCQIDDSCRGHANLEVLDPPLNVGRDSDCWFPSVVSSPPAMEWPTSTGAAILSERTPCRLMPTGGNIN
jgi:hypothetical protein